MKCLEVKHQEIKKGNPLPRHRRLRKTEGIPREKREKDEGS